MTATIALAAALAVAQTQPPGGLAVNNVRFTYRDLGPTRTDGRFLPGDVVHIAFDIDGLRMTDDGKVVYSMGMEVLDKVGKAVFSAPPSKSELVLPLGGAKLPAHVYIAVDPTLPPGTYTCRVTVADVAANATRTIEKKFDALAPDFGVVAMMVSSDDRAMIPSGTAGVVGQTVFVNFALVNFGRDATKKPNAAVEFRVLDESGRPTVGRPVPIALPRDVPERDQFVPFQIPLALSREGSYTMEIKAADKVTGKTAALTVPLKVYPASK